MPNKQDRERRWRLESTPSRTWVSFGQCDVPSKWVTLGELRALVRIDPSILMGGPGAHESSKRRQNGKVQTIVAIVF